MFYLCAICVVFHLCYLRESFVPADAADFIRRFSLMFYFCAICGKDFCRMQLLLKLRAFWRSGKSNHITNVVHAGHKLHHSFKT